jgi:hypothetical protein
MMYDGGECISECPVPCKGFLNAEPRNRVVVQFNFANLCGSFAFFAVSVLVLPQRTRRTRKETQSKCMLKPLQTAPVPEIAALFRAK